MKVESLGSGVPQSSFVEVVEPGVVAVDHRALADELSDSSLADCLSDSRQAVCITDANIDRPGPTIKFVNSAYTDIFCCDPTDVIGNNPRIGQGPLTNRKVLDRLRRHLQDAQSVQAQAINYRFDRSAFRLRWSIDPLRRDGRVVGFLAMMQDVTMEDRMRRRLTALDTLMSRGQAAAVVGRAERDTVVSDALSSALRPLMTEIGSATVTIGDTVRSTQIDEQMLSEQPPIVLEVPIGAAGTIDVSLHPDAEGLLDRLAINELGEHARWLLDLGEPR